MADINLTQADADTLIEMEKHRENNDEWRYPLPGDRMNVPLISANGREAFHLDISRGRIDLAKHTFQNRGRSVIVLVRLDLAGPSHRNPDDAFVPAPHLHVYREGFGDKWAIALPNEHFRDITDRNKTLEDFMSFCNITQKPIIREDLFS